MTWAAPAAGAHDGAQADGARPHDHHVAPEQAAGLLHRVHAHGQRFDEGAGLGGKPAGSLQQVGGDVDPFGEGAVVHQPGEGEVLADVVEAVAAVVAGAAVLAGVGGDHFAQSEALHAVAELDDLAAELVAEDALALDAGERVRRFHGDEHGAGDVLVQVGAADAAPVHADLHQPGPGRRAGARLPRGCCGRATPRHACCWGGCSWGSPGARRLPGPVIVSGVGRRPAAGR